jgi:hypothetical protein
MAARQTPQTTLILRSWRRRSTARRS